MREVVDEAEALGKDILKRGLAAHLAAFGAEPSRHIPTKPRLWFGPGSREARSQIRALERTTAVNNNSRASQ